MNMSGIRLDSFSDVGQRNMLSIADELKIIQQRYVWKSDILTDSFLLFCVWHFSTFLPYLTYSSTFYAYLVRSHLYDRLELMCKVRRCKAHIGHISVPISSQKLALS